MESVERLQRDLKHLKKAGLDSGALYERVCKYLAELVSYKDTRLTPEEIELYKEAQEISESMAPARLIEFAKAEKDGRLVVLPEVQEDDRKTFAEDLQELFDDLSNYDPSVGIFGWSDGEAALANAIMSVLNRQEAEHG